MGRERELEAKKPTSKSKESDRISIEEALQDMTSSGSSLDDSDIDTGEDIRAIQCMISKRTYICIDSYTQVFAVTNGGSMKQKSSESHLGQVLQMRQCERTAIGQSFQAT